MPDRPLAQVVDIAAARAKRGAQYGRGQARRANPGLRPPHAVWVADWDAVAGLSKREIRDVKRGVKQPPMRFKRIRRSGTVAARKVMDAHPGAAAPGVEGRTQNHQRGVGGLSGCPR